MRVCVCVCVCVRARARLDAYNWLRQKKRRVQCGLNEEPTGENEIAMRKSLTVDCSGKRGNGK